MDLAVQDLFTTLREWADAGHRAVIATVIDTWGSSPRPVGSIMAVRDDGLVFGSVSGGCVEGAVIEEAQRVLAGGPPKMLEFKGVDPEEIWRVGLTCGGRIRVLVEAKPERKPSAVSRQPSGPATEAGLWAEAERKTGARESYVWVSVAGADEVKHVLVDPSGRWLSPDPDAAKLALDGAMRAFAERRSFEQEAEGQRVFFHLRSRPERLVVVGAVHIAIPLLMFAKSLGFETVLIDPRATFASPARFPEAPDRAFSDWPQEALPKLGLDDETYAVLLSHDPKIDDPALELLLKSQARYVGALGSRTTHAARRERLLASGFSEEDVARIHGPIGLDIGARTPEEIALAIMAEVVKVRREGERQMSNDE
jgi:xanthine dehydrogenase accessory factor